MFDRLPMMILALPAILLSLSVHEASHAYAAYKLGDPTAKNLGRLTLNPLKHINLFGFIAMLFFNVGWANPVPINTRNFKDSRKGMAISSAAGPFSNLCLATIFTILLRIVLIPLQNITDGMFKLVGDTYYFDDSLSSNTGFIVLAILATMLYLGIALNLNLMVFNLIPLPPLDGSRIALMFLPTDLYFKIMRYERYIMIAFLVLMMTGVISLPLGIITGVFNNLLFGATGMPSDTLDFIITYIQHFLPKFNL